MGYIELADKFKKVKIINANEGKDEIFTRIRGHLGI